MGDLLAIYKCDRTYWFRESILAVFTLETDNPCGRIIRLVHFPSWCEFETDNCWVFLSRIHIRRIDCTVFFSQARLQFRRDYNSTIFNMASMVYFLLSSLRKRKLEENNLHVTLYRKASRSTTMETLHGKHSFSYAASGVLLATSIRKRKEPDEERNHLHPHLPTHPQNLQVSS